MISSRAAKAIGSLRLIGLVGFSGVLILNLVAWFVLKQPAAAFFSDGWWQSWFPNYTIWVVFFLSGLPVRSSAAKRNEDAE